MSLAKGSWQRWCLKQMRTPEGCPSPTRNLRGSARRYSGKYLRSFENLIRRLELAGIKVVRVSGPRGGEYGARYFIEEEIR